MCFFAGYKRDEALAAVTVGVLTVLSEQSPQQDPNLNISSPFPLPLFLKEVLLWAISRTCLKQFACYLGLHMLYVWITQNAWQIHASSFKVSLVKLDFF